MTPDEQIALEGRWYDFYKSLGTSLQEETLRTVAMTAAARGLEAPSPNLRKEVEKDFGLSYTDEFTLYGAFRVFQKKGAPVINRMIGNWRTTASAAVVAFGIYLSGPGMKFPSNAQEWKIAGLAVAIQVFGLTSKDASTGSEPGATR